MKTYYARCDIVRGYSVQLCAQDVAGRLFPPLQNGQVIGVEKDGHARLPFELALSDEPAKAGDFRECRIVLEASHDFFVPRLAALASQRSLHLGDFLFDAFQSCLELSCRLRHACIILTIALAGKELCPIPSTSDQNGKSRHRRPLEPYVSGRIPSL
jgi:hypothetical protein